jgi:hypothetical protein
MQNAARPGQSSGVLRSANQAIFSVSRILLWIFIIWLCSIIYIMSTKRIAEMESGLMRPLQIAIDKPFMA